MKRLFIISLLYLLVSTHAVLAQNNDTASANQITAPDDRVFTFIDEMAQFPGGEKAMFAFIKDNVKYPKEDRKEKREGRVLASFKIASTGEIEDIKILKGVSPTIDAEVIRVIGIMPNWIPAKQNGKAVSTILSLPVSFAL
jgi:TonB family protein